MSGLGDRLRQLILDHGPISVARFMTLALAHPEAGYYAAGEPFGAEGDFVTAPEVSQIFGELLGLALVQHWLDLDRPPGVVLVEFGPGRGTLLADLLRAAKVVPEFLDAVAIHLVETSPGLRARQAEALPGREVTWHATLDELPRDRPLFVLANEFLDALPVRQFVRQAEGWRERLVAVDEDGQFRFVIAAKTTPLGAEDGIAVGTLLELGPAREAVAEALAARLVEQGGVALLIDYGSDTALMTGDSFRAVRRHAAADPLEEPGRADLSAHVDFRAVALRARKAGAAVYGPLPQGEFLGRLGIAQRLRRLLQGATPEQKALLESGCHRLVAPEAMGELFKVLALVAPGAPAPPGFTERERR